MSEIRGKSRERKLAAEANAMWFLVLWDDGNHTPVPRKAIEGDVPEVGDWVKVKEDKDIYEGQVIRKGTKREVFRRAEELENQSCDEESSEDEVEDKEVEEELPPPKKKKTTPRAAETEAKEAKKCASRERTLKKKARERLQQDDSQAILAQLGLTIGTDDNFDQGTLPITTSITTQEQPAANGPDTLTADEPTTQEQPAVDGPSTLTAEGQTTTTTTKTTTTTTMQEQPAANGGSSHNSVLSLSPIVSHYDSYNDYDRSYPQDMASLQSTMVEVLEKMGKLESILEEIKRDISRLKRKGSTQAGGGASGAGSAGIGRNLRSDFARASTPSPTNGVVLGDPATDDAVTIEGISQTAIRNAELTSLEPGKLAVSLLVALFKPEDIATGNCTKATREDISILDQTKIQAIRAHLKYRFPVSTSEEATRWKDILKKKLNAKCRNSRQKK